MSKSEPTDESRRPPTEIHDLVAAIQEFEVALPGWCPGPNLHKQRQSATAHEYALHG